MTDRRFLQNRGGEKTGVLGPLLRVNLPVVDLLASPKGARDKQLCFGQAFQTLDFDPMEPWVFGCDPLDGYVGYLPPMVLDGMPEPTHKVIARHCHVYTEADFKSPEWKARVLSFGSHLAITSSENGYHELEAGGYVMEQHVCRIGDLQDDPAKIAESFLGTPYLWGGNSGFGIDCSGLVQSALVACGIRCPRDSDLQAAAFAPVADRAELERGDLVFWKGHVGMMLDRDTLIHANAHHMAVAVEPLDGAIARIGQREFGAVTGFAKPPKPKH